MCLQSLRLEDSKSQSRSCHWNSKIHSLGLDVETWILSVSVLVSMLRLGFCQSRSRCWDLDFVSLGLENQILVSLLTESFQVGSACQMEKACQLGTLPNLEMLHNWETLPNWERLPVLEKKLPKLGMLPNWETHLNGKGFQQTRKKCSMFLRSCNALSWCSSIILASFY